MKKANSATIIRMSKSAKGTQKGDAANIAVRNILTELSGTLFHQITQEELFETEKYFGWKCPYTGKDLKEAIEKGEAQLDHIVPQNKDYCGLNIKGNLIYVDKTANAKKSTKNYDDFIRNNIEVINDSQQIREERIQKIKNWQKQCGYDSKALREELSPLVQNVYKQVQENQSMFIADLTQKVEHLVPKKATIAPFTTVASPIPQQAKKVTVGQYVKKELTKLLESGRLNKCVIDNLQDKTYCSKTFKISFPAIVDVSNAFESKRYYPNVICGKFRICSQWYEKNKALFEQWNDTQNMVIAIVKTPEEAVDAIKEAVKNW